MTLKVEYDDHLDEVIDKVNEALRRFNLEFVCYELPHDGFMIYEVKRIGQKCPFCDDIIPHGFANKMPLQTIWDEHLFMAHHYPVGEPS